MTPHRISIAVAGAILALAAAVPAHAATFMFTTTMNGANEAPANASPGTGFATVVFDDVAGTVSVTESWANLLGTVNNNHIHIASAPGGTGGVALGFGTVPAVATGSFSATFTPANFAALLTGANAGLDYVNLHSTAIPGGEIRGFLAPVPEASTLVMMLAGIAGLGALARRRTAR